MISFKKFLKAALEPVPHLRAGQKLILNLHDERPDLYDRILCDPLDAEDSAARYDCFYDDSKMWETIQWLRSNW